MPAHPFSLFVEMVEMVGNVAPSAYNRARTAYQRHRLLVFLGIAGVAAILGFVGMCQLHVTVETLTRHVFRQSGNAPFGVTLATGASERVPWPDRIYYTLNLFRFGVPPSPYPLPWTLEVARWLAPLSLILVGLSAIFAIFAEQATQARVSIYRDHWIVCGAGRIGMRLATRLRSDRERVVVIDRDPTVADLEECRRLGVPVLRGDATDLIVLDRARVRRASHVIVVTGDDGVNTEIAEQVGDLAARSKHRRHAPLGCYVNVDDEELCTLLDQQATFRHRAWSTVVRSKIRANEDLVLRSAFPIRFRFFNVFRLAPQAILDDERFSLFLRERKGMPPWLVIVGTGPIGINLAVVAAQRWQNENEETDPHLRITMVDVDSEAQVGAMRERWSCFRRVCDLDSITVDPWHVYSDPFGYVGRQPTPTGAIICPLDDADGLRMSVSFRRWLPDDTPIVLCTTRRNDSGPLLDLASVEFHGDIYRISVLEEVCQQWIHLILNPQKIESLARSAHHNYVRHRLEEGQTGDASAVPWDLLPDYLRKSNLRQAENFGGKLHQIGYRIEPATDSDARAFEFSPEEIEELAEMEHSDWNRERLEAGWSYAVVKNIRERQSPYLICWQCLPESVRDYDREAMRDLPLAFVREGLCFVPLESDATVPESRQKPELHWPCPKCGGPLVTSAQPALSEK